MPAPGARGLPGSRPVLLTGAPSPPFVTPTRQLAFLCIAPHVGIVAALVLGHLCRVSRSHTCPWFFLLCKCHVPHPYDTWALNTGVFPVSTPRTMFSQHLLPALPPPRGTGGGGRPGCSGTRMYGSFYWAPVLRSCTLWNIKQFVIEGGGLLLVCIPSGGRALVPTSGLA